MPTVEAFHPIYEYFDPIWKMMRSCEAGEEAIKEETTSWLAMPTGFTKQSDGGSGMYASYLSRAQFPDILQPTLSGMVGVIHRVEATIEGLEDNKPLAYMWEKCTKDDKLPLETFHRRITTEILLMGRYGVFVDVPSGNDPEMVWEKGQPYFVGYSAEQIINWSEFEQDLFVLDETRKIRNIEGGDEFAWVEEKRFRVLRMADGKYQVQVYGGEQLQAGELISPQLRGGKALEEIPFVIAGPRELTVRYIDQPPLKGVARASIGIYRFDADYRHQLFNSGQETLFVIGETENIPNIVGSGVVIGIPVGGDAKYVGPSGVGMEAHRQAMLDARAEAVAAGVRLFDTQAKTESGEALRLRGAAQTATLTTIAKASAACLERALRYAAQFVGQKPEEIVVKPNLEFVDTRMLPTEAVKLVELWQSGAISKQTMYENLQRGEIATDERTFEDEQELIEQEAIDDPLSPLAKQKAEEEQMQMQAGGPNPSLNGGAPAQQIPSRFIETGEGLTIERASGKA